MMKEQPKTGRFFTERKEDEKADEERENHFTAADKSSFDYNILLVR